MRQFLIRLGLVAVLAAVAFTAATLPTPFRVDVGAQSTFPPQYLPSVSALPMCYDQVNGAARVVSPFRVNGATIPDCRPPSPWDTVGEPGAGWNIVACNGGGSFDCRRSEFFTELAGAH